MMEKEKCRKTSFLLSSFSLSCFLRRNFSTCRIRKMMLVSVKMAVTIDRTTMNFAIHHLLLILGLWTYVNPSIPAMAANTPCHTKQSTCSTPTTLKYPNDNSSEIEVRVPTSNTDVDAVRKITTFGAASRLSELYTFSISFMTFINVAAERRRIT